MEVLSPVVERRSRRIAPINHSNEVHPEEFNDDEEERKRYRQQQEQEASRNRTINAKRSLTSHENFAKILRFNQMSQENKITQKNAFKIEFFDPFFACAKESETNFNEISHSLVTAAKIYACRVDNTHTSAANMLKTLHPTKEKGNDEERTGDDEDPSSDAVKKKKTKKKGKNMLATNFDQINKTKSDFLCHVSNTSLNNEDFITNKAIFDNSGMCLRINMNSNFWLDSYHAKKTKSSNEISIQLPNLEDEVICPTFKDFSFLRENNNHNISFKETLLHEYIEQDTFDDRSEAPELGGVDDVEDVGDNVVAEMDCLTSETVCRNAPLSKVMSSSAFVTDLSKLIASEKSEYRYFNMEDLANKWSLQSLDQWKPFAKKKGKVTKPRSQKKDLIDFLGNNDFSPFETKDRPLLTVTTPANRDRFLMIPITTYTYAKFFCYRTWREQLIPLESPDDEQPSDFEENVNEYDYDNAHDSQYGVLDRCEDDNAENISVENFGNGVDVDVHDAINRSNEDDDSAEIPSKVPKLFWTAEKEKSIDMKELKSQIWRIIDDPEKEKSQEIENQLLFSNIYEKMITDQRNEISVPILFNAILQLANEKNLQFDSLQTNSSNFSIRVSNAV